MRQPLALALLGVLSTLAQGCDGGSQWPPSPRTLRPGEEVCAECRMFVSDARFAVQSHSRTGVVEWYDDLGCLLESHPDGVDPLGVFVTDFHSGHWVRGDQGRAARVAGIESPMGYGWTVHSTAAAASPAAGQGAGPSIALYELLRGSVGRPQKPASSSPDNLQPEEGGR